MMLDDATAAVLRTHQILKAISPRTNAGRIALKERKPFAKSDQERFDRERGYLQQMEGHPDALQHVGAQLEELPDPTHELTKIRAREDLEEVELFAVKRFLFYGIRALEEAKECLAFIPAHERDRLQENLTSLMAAIHPEPAPSARFRIGRGHFEALDEARTRARASGRLYAKRREELEQDVLSRWGGRFDFDGNFQPPANVSTRQLQESKNLVEGLRGWELDDQTLQALKAEHESHQEEIRKQESIARRQLSDRIRQDLSTLDKAMEVLATLDMNLALVEYKHSLKGCWPRWSDEIQVEEGIPPFVVAGQPVDWKVPMGATVITGPNMGGKSTLLRQLGRFLWAAHYLFPVPARSFTFRPVQAIVYTGPHLLSREEPGLSSFAQEVSRVVKADGHDGTVWLLDEFGRGTHPADGSALAVKLIRRLSSRAKNSVVAASHFPEVAKLTNAQHLQIRGLRDREGLARKLQDAGQDTIASLLVEAMDYQPEPVRKGEIPRDARFIASALGLSFDDDP